MPLAIALLVLASRPTEIVFVRHGETVANATGKYNSRTLNVFSARGQQQVAKLTVKLKGMKFDAIIVSPSGRALRTLAPYLRATHQTAEIWPELYECCHQVGAARLKPAAKNVVYSSRITIPHDLAGLYRLRPGGERYISAPTYNDGMRQVKIGWQLLLQDFAGTGKTVLVIGHSLQGSRMLELLEGKAPVGKLRPDNTEIWRMVQGPGKTFTRASG